MSLFLPTHSHIWSFFYNFLGMGLLISSFCIVLLSYVCIGAFINYRKLRQFKGPPLAGFSRFWLFWQSWNARLNIAEYEAVQQYGPVCRIGPNLLVTSDADIVRHMSAPGSAWRRSGWYDGMKLDPRIDTVFSTRDEKLHADLKAKEAGAVCRLALSAVCTCD